MQAYLHSTSSRRVLDTLLDLICVEGIYPNFLPGVGIAQHRLSPALRDDYIEEQENAGFEPDSAMLQLIVDRFCEVIGAAGAGLSAIVQGRTLADLLGAILQLAYGPGLSQDHRQQHITQSREIIDGYDSLCVIRSCACASFVCRSQRC